MSEDPVKAVKKTLPPEKQKILTELETINNNPLEAIRDYVPDDQRPAYELAVKLQNDPDGTLKSMGVSDEDIKLYKTA